MQNDTEMENTSPPNTHRYWPLVLHLRSDQYVIGMSGNQSKDVEKLLFRGH